MNTATPAAKCTTETLFGAYAHTRRWIGSPGCSATPDVECRAAEHARHEWCEPFAPYVWRLTYGGDVCARAY